MTPPSQIAHYRILSKLGEGGMGAVYRASDTKLNREVAIKVLPEALANDPDYLARFTREAQVLASLNHPNIAVIFGVEDKALVMELIPGQTLEERIAAGPIPLDEALSLARQIAEALEAAHEKGIVHRDLKPANIKVTPEGIVKVLDFGLAKTAEPVANISTANSPTLTIRSTQLGVIMGTAGYMAPEQAAGKVVDRRADIWSFGVVLRELLTGKPLFGGETVAHTLASVLKDQIDIDIPQAPPTIRTLLARCLTRDPKERLRDIGEARIAIRDFLAHPIAELAKAPRSAAASNIWRVAPWIAAAVLAAFGAWGWLKSPPPAQQTMRFLIPPPEGSQPQLFDSAMLSPDGRRIVFPMVTPKGRQLALRALDDPSFKVLPDTEGAMLPFWSPDSRQIAFTTPKGIKKIDLTGGPAVTLCPESHDGGTWNRDGVILASGPGGLFRLSANGGAVTPVTKLDTSRGENFHGSPSFLPDGKHFLFNVISPRRDVAGIYVGELGSSKISRIQEESSSAQYSDGFLLYSHAETLTARPFDVSQLKATGDAFPVAEKIGRYTQLDLALFSTGGGHIVFAGATSAESTEMIWFDRKGTRLSSVGSVAQYSNPALSPDGRQVAVGIADKTTSKRDIWLVDLVRGGSMRLTFDPADDFNPTWSPDSKQIIFTSDRAGTRDLYRKAANGAGPDEVLLASVDTKAAEDWTKDGKTLLFNTNQGGISSLDVSHGAGAQPAVVMAGSVDQGHISPDGRWIAYRSRESGTSEVFVQNYPPAGGKWQISTAGGAEPQWRADGKELFYVQSDKTLVAVDIHVSAKGELEPGIPKPLFDASLPVVRRNRFVASADGQKFLVITRQEQNTTAPVMLVLNWAAAVKH